MRAPVAFRFARRELGGGLRGFRVFLACLTLGVAAVAAVGSVRDSIEAGLVREGATLLGGDAEVTFTYRRASAGERAVLEAEAEALAEVIDFRSMVQLADGSDRALTQVKAVDAAWPLLGAPVLEPEMPLAEALAGADGLPGAVMEPLLIARLGLAPGDTFTLGDQPFRLSAALVSLPDNASAGFGFGPRTLVLSEDLVASGLIRAGTLFDAEYRMLLPPDTDLAEAKARITGALAEGAPQWKDARNGAPGASRAVERLASFLVLVGIAGLAVGGVGISAAVRSYLDEKTETIATLKVLGAGRGTVLGVYALQIGALSLVGIGAGLALGAALPLAFAPLITAALPLPATIGIAPAALAEAALYGALAAALFTLWPLARAQDIRAAALYRDAATGARNWPRWPYLLLSAALLATLIAAAALFSGSAKLTLWAALGIFGAFVMLVLAGWLVRLLARHVAGSRLLRGAPNLRLAFAAVGGPGNEAASVVLSLGLGLSVLAAVGQIDNNLRGAIARELPSIAPSLFVLDIQPDQIDALRARVQGDEGVSRMDTAPMLRGIITQINGRPAQEVAPGHWVLRGDRGVTYAAELPERNRLTAGEWWAADYTGPPQISVSAREAEELGLALGDTLSVNILGREIAGEITSFRDVDFTNAGMGFILALNPSALAGAPHSWIATIYAERAVEPVLMRDLSRGYPNITIISVRDAIAQVTGLMGRIAAAITYGALMTLVTGAVVLVGAAAAGERSRTYEAAILKTLGAPRGRVLGNFALRSAILGAAAGGVAVAAGGMAGWAVSTFVMETGFVFDVASALEIVLGGIVLTTLAGLAFAWRPLSASPASVLRGRE